MIYLSGADNKALRAVADTASVGLIVTPGIRYATSTIDRYRWWAADNACYKQGDAFDLGQYLAWLEKHSSIASKCLFATAPDVVSDWQATWKRSADVLPKIRGLGYRAAVVLQDGCVDVPWDEIDAVFVGASVAWKLLHVAAKLCHQAADRGKLVHVGKVSSSRRMMAAQQMRTTSCDGTFLAFGPDKNLPRVMKWLKNERENPCLNLTWK